MSGASSSPRSPAQFASANSLGAPDGELLIKSGGKSFTGWTAVNVTRGVERMPSDFEIEGTSKHPGEMREGVKVGDPLQITIGGHVVLTGYLERMVKRTADEQHTISLIGRGRCCDLVDTSAVIDSMSLTNASIAVLARELLRPYAGPISLVTPDGDGDAKQYMSSVNLGESPYELIERMARYEGLLVYENADGNLVLARVGKAKHSSGFVEGQNIQSIETSSTRDERFSVYIPLLMSSDTISARPGMAGGGNAAGAPVTDPGIKRYRPRIIVSEQNTNDTFLAAQRAQWEATRRAGRSERISIVCDSWLDSAGTPWTPNQIATLALPRWGVGEVELCITEVTYRRDGQGGTTAHVLLMPREALTVEPSALNAMDARSISPRTAPENNPTGTPTVPAPPPTAPNAGTGRRDPAQFAPANSL